MWPGFAETWPFQGCPARVDRTDCALGTSNRRFRAVLGVASCRWMLGRRSEGENGLHAPHEGDIRPYCPANPSFRALTKRHPAEIGQMSAKPDQKQVSPCRFFVFRKAQRFRYAKRLRRCATQPTTKERTPLKPGFDTRSAFGAALLNHRKSPKPSPQQPGPALPRACSAWRAPR